MRVVPQSSATNWWLKITQIYCLIVLEAKCSKLTWINTALSLKPVEKVLPCLPIFADSRQSLAFLGLGMDHSTLLFSHSLFPDMSESLHLCICLYFLISNKNTSHTGLGAQSTPVWPHPSKLHLQWLYF